MGIRRGPIIQGDGDGTAVAHPCQLEGYACDNPRPGIVCENEAASCIDNGAA